MFATLDEAARAGSRRALTTTVSLGAEAAAVGLLILAPLLYTAALPNLSISTPITAPRASGAVELVGHEHAAPASRRSEGAVLSLRQPRFIPRGIAKTHDDVAASRPPADPFAPSGRDGAGGDPNGIPTVLLGPTTGTPPPLPPAPPTHARPPMRISHFEPGDLLVRVQPQYPIAAKLAHVQGPVVLQALIGRDGAIERLRLVSGHPMLADAALAAVRQWRFRPYVLNNEAIEVETQITVNFTLAQ
jgi:periplasmic protein TonB